MKELPEAETVEERARLQEMLDSFTHIHVEMDAEVEQQAEDLVKSETKTNSLISVAHALMSVDDGGQWHRHGYRHGCGC